MIRKIIGTLSTRIMSSFILMIIVLVNARCLGAARVGTISLAVLSITIIQLVTNFAGGASIVYLMPRTRVIMLLVPSYLQDQILQLCLILSVVLNSYRLGL